MRKKEIFLDFTSLLDVTLIIIFFFVLFSHFESEQNKSIVEMKIKELEKAVQMAEDREEIADSMVKQLEKEIAIVRESSERHESNLVEMLDFSKSGNLKVLLKMRDKEAIVQICRNNEIIERIELKSILENDFLNAIKKAGCNAKDTIYCDFVFDGSEPGTASAYRKVAKEFDKIKKTFKYFYYSETDVSIGE